jgi:hypothetical protein
MAWSSSQCQVAAGSSRPFRSGLTVEKPFSRPVYLEGRAQGLDDPLHRLRVPAKSHGHAGERLRLALDAVMQEFPHFPHLSSKRLPGILERDEVDAEGTCELVELGGGAEELGAAREALDGEVDVRASLERPFREGSGEPHPPRAVTLHEVPAEERHKRAGPPLEVETIALAGRETLPPRPDVVLEGRTGHGFSMASPRA